MYTEIIDQIAEQLDDQSKKIIISSHKNPDGDAIGSSLALYEFLISQGLQVHVIVPNHFPEFLAWIENSNQIVIYQDQKTEADRLLDEADLIFCLDYNALHRTGMMSEPLSNAKGVKVLIDHHLEPTNDFDIIYSETKVSSTAELIFNLIYRLSKGAMSKQIAIPIFVGIMTDTGSFSYACDYPSTFKTVSKLLESGINIREINQNVYHTNTEQRTKLLGFSLSERLVVNNNLKTAYIYLSKEDLQQFNYQIGDTEGIVNYALAVKGVVFSALFTEKDGLIRISFRSKGAFDVNQFARKHFDGGGHMNAAGGNSTKSLVDAIKDFENILPSYKSELF